MKTIKILFLLFLGVCSMSYINPVGDEKSVNYLTFYYVDNSDGSNANSLDDELVEQLKDNLKKLANRPDNYFFFYGCNGQEQLTSSSLTTFSDSPKLKKYLKNPSKESEYAYDKKIIRDYFTEYPVKIKQTMEFNIYLSTYAAKRLTKEIENLPTPILLMNEIPIFLNVPNLKDVNIKTNIYINKDAKDETAAEDKIMEYLTFCREQLHLEKSLVTVKYI